MEVDVMVTEHRKTETADKEPRFTVVLKGITSESQEVKLSVKAKNEDLFEKYPLKTHHAIKVATPQTRLG